MFDRDLMRCWSVWMCRSQRTCRHTSESMLDAQCSCCVGELYIIDDVTNSEDRDARNVTAEAGYNRGRLQQRQVTAEAGYNRGRLQQRRGEREILRAFVVCLTSSPLYCLRQWRKRQVLDNQKETVSKSSPRFWKEREMG